MPKAASSSNASDQKHHLRRNQACHQCRKRKLKCDAKRPCTCCRRSHANVIAALAMKGEPFSAEPTCTYDDPRGSQRQSPPRIMYFPPAYTAKGNTGSLELATIPAQRPEPSSLSTAEAQSASASSAPNTYDVTSRHNDLPLEFDRPFGGYSSFSSRPSSRDAPRSDFRLPVPPGTRSRTVSSTGSTNGILNSHSFSSSGVDPRRKGSLPTASFSFTPGPASVTHRSSSHEPSAPMSHPFSSSSHATKDPLEVNSFSSVHAFGSAVHGLEHDYRHNRRSRSPQRHADIRSLSSSPLPGQSSIHSQSRFHAHSYTYTNLPSSSSLSQWPTSLPTPPLLTHLIETFFATNPLAPRLLHRPSFIPSISLSPKDSRFPSVPLLHAICALACLYTPAAVLSPSQYGTGSMKAPSHGGNPSSWSHSGSGVRSAPESTSKDYEAQNALAAFADEQAELARNMTHDHVRHSRRMLECVQTTVILGWYNYANARWVDTWTTAGAAIRQALPIGINGDGSFDGLLIDSWRDRALNAKPKGAEELEQRRSTFWLAFLSDTHQLVSTGWPGAIDETDISQTFPCALQDFENATDIRLPRQNVHSADVFTHHPPGLTDGFTLHIKASILIGRVAKFNSRLRVQYNLGEIEDSSIDIRLKEDFKVLESNIHAFRGSIPADMKDYLKIRGGSKAGIDANLYVAHILPAAALILLHDPHAEVADHTDISAQTILQAARFILDTIYTLTATSFDLSLLIHNTVLYWAKSAAVFIRFYGNALQHGLMKEALAFKAEADIVKGALTRMGERLPVARSLSRMVQDWIDSASAIANNTDPAVDQVWSYLRYSERKKIGLRPAIIGDRHVD